MWGRGGGVGAKVVATNKLIKTFCQKYTLVQFFEYNKILREVGCFPRSYHI